MRTGPTCLRTFLASPPSVGCVKQARECLALRALRLMETTGLDRWLAGGRIDHVLCMMRSVDGPRSVTGVDGAAPRSTGPRLCVAIGQ